MDESRFWLDSPAAIRRAAAYLVGLRVDWDHPIEMIVRPPYREITKSHRNHFHAICDDVGDQLGYSRGQIKAAIKEDYFGVDKVRIGRRVYKQVESTESQDDDRYRMMIEFAYAWAAERGITVRDRRRPKPIGEPR